MKNSELWQSNIVKWWVSHMWIHKYFCKKKTSSTIDIFTFCELLSYWLIIDHWLIVTTIKTYFYFVAFIYIYQYHHWLSVDVVGDDGDYCYDHDDDVIICNYHFLTYSVSCSMVMIVVIIMAMANGSDIFDWTLPVLSRRRNGSKQRRRPWMTTAVVIAFGLYRLVVENGVFFTGQWVITMAII